MKKIIRILLCILMMVVLLGTAVFGGYLLQTQNSKDEEASSTISEDDQDDWAEPDAEYLDYYGLGDFSTTLPVVYINTKGQQILKENSIWGNIALLEASETAQSVSSVPNSIYRATIKYRGASSYSKFAKKQYRIKFYKDKKNKAKNVSLAGMGENSEWVLNGPYLDKTLIRNKLMYDLARECNNGWAPDSRFVELFVDGEYQGVYVAIEPVTNGTSRLRLSEYGLLSGETAYIVDRNRDSTDEEALVTYGKTSGNTNNSLYLTYPSAKDVTDAQKEYIIEDISAFEKALYGADFRNSKSGYQSYIDVDNWVDYFILNEFSMNSDAGNLSTYVYKDLPGKLQLAVWDFNNGFDNYQWFSMSTNEFNTTENSWFNRIWQDEDFQAKVKARYKELRQTTLSDEHIESLIASYQAQLGDAVSRNFAIWGYSFDENLLAGKKADGSSRDITSYDSAMTQLKDTIHDRLEFLDEEWGS